MRPYEFVETEADRTFKNLTEWNADLARTALHVEYGDPARYGLESYEAVWRVLRRIVNFEPSSAYSSYAFRGDPLYVQQIAIGSTRRETDYIIPPHHMLTLPTEGVAGALRLLSEALFLPPGKDGAKDNMIAPMYTYLSHMAEVVRRNAEIKSCMLERDGQVDLKHMENLIDTNTQAVVIATVGNPLGIAISHQKYEDMLILIHNKMKEYNHPIWLIADVIYEHFRRDENGPRLEPIQKSLSMGRSGIDVPTAEVSSFSKMFAMAGQRLGYAKFLASVYNSIEKSDFCPERRDALKAIEIVYDTSLCPVPRLLQKAMGKVYFSINNRLLCEERFAPFAATLSALDNLAKLGGKGDSHTMMPEEVPEEIVRTLGLDPSVWFTSSAVAKRTRKLAQNELSRYAVDIHTSKIERIGQRLIEAGLIEERTIEIDRETMTDVFVSAVSKCGNCEQKLLMGLIDAERILGKSFTDEERKVIVDSQLAQLTKVDIKKAAEIRQEMENLQSDFKINPGDGEPDEKIKLVFYRLKEGVKIPELPLRPDGQLELYGIAEKIFLKKLEGGERWEEIAKACRLPTEDILYQIFKEKRREDVFSRIDTFVNAIEDMRKKGLGVYLHPSYYDDEGVLHLERINSFYVLFGFEKLKDSNDQSSAFMATCVANGEEIVKTTAGSIFLAPDVRELEDSYIRFVPLLEIGDDEVPLSKSDMGKALRAIEVTAKTYGTPEIAAGSAELYAGD